MNIAEPVYETKKPFPQGPFRLWGLFQEFDAEVWDKQFEADVTAGRLDALAEDALRDLHEGRSTDL